MSKRCAYCGADAAGQHGWITAVFPARAIVSVGALAMEKAQRPEDILTCRAEVCRNKARRDSGYLSRHGHDPGDED